MAPSPAVVTLWYLTTDNPGPVLAARYRSDRGFGRKFLAQLAPGQPVTPIGQFSLSRSEPVGPAEFYIGAYPSVTVVQTLNCTTDLRLSQLSPALRAAAPAQTLLCFLQHDDSGTYGFARFEAGELKRSFCASRTQVIEDSGIPGAAEGPFWAGQHRPDDQGGIALPFEPQALAAAVATQWLGVDITSGAVDLNVVGFATDGRPEPKVAEPSSRQRAAAPAQPVDYGNYDDYEEHIDPDSSAPPVDYDAVRERGQHYAQQLGRAWGRAHQAANQALRSVAQSLQRRWRS